MESKTLLQRIKELLLRLSLCLLARRLQCITRRTEQALKAMWPARMELRQAKLLPPSQAQENLTKAEHLLMGAKLPPLTLEELELAVQATEDLQMSSSLLTTILQGRTS